MVSFPQSTNHADGLVVKESASRVGGPYFKSQLKHSDLTHFWLQQEVHVAMASLSFDFGFCENHTDTQKKDSRRISCSSSRRKTSSVCCCCLGNVMETRQATRNG